MAGYFAESKFTSQEDHELRLESYLASNLGHVFVMAIFYTKQLYHPDSILIKETHTRCSTIPDFIRFGKRKTRAPIYFIDFRNIPCPIQFTVSLSVFPI